MSASYPTPHPTSSESPLSPSQKLAQHLNGHAQSMDGRQNDYPQSGITTDPPYLVADNHSEHLARPDQASAAQYQGSDPRSSNFSSSATPTSDYGINPSSARSGSFPEYVQRGQYPPGQPPAAANMAQATSPSLPLSDGTAATNNDHAQNNKSDPDVPIDPSIAAATSPTYPPHNQYSPYPPEHHIPQYGAHPGTPVYAARPDWAQQYPHMYGHAPVSSGPPAPSMVSPVQRPPGGGHPLSTVYSFVPIPGAQQHKRPRRRYEEIERMYKCGWNGCEKAYGTLNHLNAHVTMQSHGQKRTPEEFKEIRKEWKAKKKEEEAQRKADEERRRQNDVRNQQEGSNAEAPMYGDRQMGQSAQMGGPQLPPIGYAPAGATGQPTTQYSTQSPSAIGDMTHYPQSPYTQGQQMYQQPTDNGSTTFQQ